MNRWSALAVILAFAGALAFRLPQLDTRPLHNDEAVNAVKVAELWETGRYRYDPHEYHGPTLHYATLPFLSLSSAAGPKELKDRTLRLAPVVFGAALVLLLLLLADGIGRHAVIWSALFIAISPAMVFYSRYFIHEMLLVFFSLLTIGSAWRYVRSRSTFLTGGTSYTSPSYMSPLCAITTGLGLGLMFGTKETFVLSLAAMVLAAFATAIVTRRSRGVRWLDTALDEHTDETKNLPDLQSLPPDTPSGSNPATIINRRDLALAFTTTFFVWLLFFSSFFTNFQGLLDSFLTYVPWLKRAGGDSPHIHPWHFYLQRLAWFHPVKGPYFSEALILLLALAGAVVAIRRKNPLLRFLALYTILLTAIYSVISYKTPWCLLNFYIGMILLAGVGAAAIVELVRRRPFQIVIAALILAASTQLAAQSWRASYKFSSDRRNPYVYAQTVPDILNLVARAEGLARVSPDGFETVVKVIAPENDYWPLPWYLRRFEHIGWYDQLPEDPFSPIIIVSSKLDARLDDASERKWLMAGLTELRPGQFFELYVELQLWTRYVETLPPPPE